MPQMYPMNWIFLFFFFILIILILSYFSLLQIFHVLLFLLKIF